MSFGSVFGKEGRAEVLPFLARALLLRVAGAALLYRVYEVRRRRRRSDSLVVRQEGHRDRPRHGQRGPRQGGVCMSERDSCFMCLHGDSA